MRKTKIIATIGPSSMDASVFKEMCLQGLNVARLNFSHGDHNEQQQKIDMIKAVRDELQLPIAIMLDTKGPEYRIKTFKNGKVTVPDGAPFTFTTRDVEGDESIVSVSYAGLADEISVGDRILVCNGLVIFEVTDVEGTEIHCTTVCGGELGNRKSMSFPGKVLRQVYLSEQDKADLLFGIKNDVDFVAASFVSTKQDVLDLRKFLNDNGGEKIEIIAKIENQSGVDNIEEICQACEGIMVARGDLGVEVPFTQLPGIQKHLIDTCRMLGRRVITATEMLESMITNPRPTRAEISDVANAVYDGTSAIMLSGETANGKYPVEAIHVMSEIAKTAEDNIDYNSKFQTRTFKIRNTVDAISHAACTMAIDLNAKAIVVSSLSGITVRMVSRFRPSIPILGFATEKKVWNKLALSWGVTPVLSKQFNSMEVLNYFTLEGAKEALGLQAGDIVVMTGGNTSGESGNTNHLRIETIK